MVCVCIYIYIIYNVSIYNLLQNVTGIPQHSLAYYVEFPGLKYLIAADRFDLATEIDIVIKDMARRMSHLLNCDILHKST